MSHLAHANGYYIVWEGVKPAGMLQASIDSSVRKGVVTWRPAPATDAPGIYSRLP